MTQEEKQLLLTDLCARLPYGVKVDLFGQSKELIGVLNDIISVGYDINDYDDAPIEDIKPYLRQISSMTEDEMFNFHENGGTLTHYFKYDIALNSLTVSAIDWLTAHHFDYRGLIEKGLALEAPEDMYK